MSERYSKLFSLTENLYTESAPVVIAAGALLKDNQTGSVLAQLKFQSISPKPILAVKVAISAYDVSGNELADVAEHSFLDLKVNRNAAFGQKSPVPMPDKNTRSFQVVVTEVVFTDHSQWHPAEKAQWTKLSAQNSLTSVLGQQLAEQYRRELGSDLKNAPTTDRDLWLCACGNINHSGEARCYKCIRDKDALFSALDKDALQEHLAEYNRQQKEKAEKEAAQKAEEAARQAVVRRKTAIVCGIVAVVVAIVLVVTQVIMPAVSYNGAVALMEAGQYEDAVAKFEKLGDYKDSTAMIASCQQTLADIAEEEAKLAAYNAAVAFQQNGDYEEAIAAFTALNGYKDSADRSIDCETAFMDSKYNDAIALMDAGQYEDAGLLFDELGDYKDSVTQVIDAKYKYADSLYEIGSIVEAAELFGELGDYSDSADRSADIYYELAETAFVEGDFEKSLSYGDKIKECDLLTLAAAFADTSSSQSLRIVESMETEPDITDRVKEYVYEYATALLTNNKPECHDFSHALFTMLGNYQDSAEKLQGFVLRPICFGTTTLSYDEYGLLSEYTYATKFGESVYKRNNKEETQYSFDLNQYGLISERAGPWTYTYGSNSLPSKAYHDSANSFGDCYYTFEYERDSAGNIVFCRCEQTSIWNDGSTRGGTFDYEFIFSYADGKLNSVKRIEYYYDKENLTSNDDVTYAYLWSSGGAYEWDNAQVIALYLSRVSIQS